MSSGRHCALRRSAAACLFLLSGVAPHAAAGQTPPPCERAVLTLSEAAALLRVDAADVARLAEQGKVPAKRVGSEWRFSCPALLTWLAALPLTTQEMTAVTGSGRASVQAGTPPPGGAGGAPSKAGGQDRPIGEAPKERPAGEISLRGQRVLLGRGDVVMDFGLFYARSDDYVLAAINSGVGLATFRYEALTTLLQGRVGLFNETELFAGTTFNREESRQFFGAADLTSDRRGGFGGATIGVRRTLFGERARRPSIIATFSGTIPGDGRPYVVGGGVVLVKSVDPAALFLNANYFRAIRRGSTTPGSAARDSVDLSVGYALALNDTLAISMAVSGLFTNTAAALDETRFRRPDTYFARFGVTSWLAKGLYIEPSVSFALTGPGRSFAFGLTLPYAF